MSLIVVINGDYLNGFLRYSGVIENAFNFYKNKLHSQIKLEQQNNNNSVVIAQTNLILHSLDMSRKNLLNNISVLFEKSENHGNRQYLNAALLRSVLNIYGKDLDRGIVLLENEYEYYLKEHDILKEEAELVNELVEIIKRLKR
ncbi:MAG: hypothetical protein L0H55_12780 [Candidatus Nitrosocosmicus sp.]|nr:hypothetical protein [Candidatus Nitrosocosmicus sp.]